MKKQSYICKGRWSRWLPFLLAVLSCAFSPNVVAQKNPVKKAPRKASIYNSLPSGYSQVGDTRLYYYYTYRQPASSQSLNSIDIIGLYDGKYYSSTYNDAGYRIAMKVGDNVAVHVHSLNGTTSYGVTLTTAVEAQAELTRMVYTLKNDNANDVTVSVGVHADVMIEDNDHAPLERRIDRSGNTYGMTMKNGNGAQLCALFGSGLTGVTGADDFWFGYWTENDSPWEMVGNYGAWDASSYYMQENGDYDSGMGWCWKNRLIPAGESIQLSWIIGVGEVNLEPNSDFSIIPIDPSDPSTPTDSTDPANPETPSSWNDISSPQTFTVIGYFESPFGQDGYIEYSAEDSVDWTVINEEPIPSGTYLSEQFTLTFDPHRDIHEIRFRTRDFVGNSTLLPSVEFVDVCYHSVTGFEDFTYTGNPITQPSLTHDMDESKWTTYYVDNVNAGTATFVTEGLYPYSIGRVEYTFTINPAPITGDIVVEDGQNAYDGGEQKPTWLFTDNNFNSLQEGVDYVVESENNILPGTASFTVTGIGNYTGTFSGTFTIDRGRINSDLYQVNIPESDITYDGLPHVATATTNEGVGTVAIKYKRQGDDTFLEEAPSQPGNYDVYLGIAENELYYGMESTKVGSFTIYAFSNEEWAALVAIHNQLINQGWEHPWDISGGIVNVGNIPQLTIEKGHVVGVDLSGENISGIFPDEISQLPYLRRIDVSGNQLLGINLNNMPSLSDILLNPQQLRRQAIDGKNGYWGILLVEGFDMTTMKNLSVNGREINVKETYFTNDGYWYFPYTPIPSNMTFDISTGVVNNVMHVIIDIEAKLGEDGGFVDGINNIQGKSFSQDEVSYYDLQGRIYDGKLANKGIYISKSKKIVVK